jgi:chaperonin GroEL
MGHGHSRCAAAIACCSSEGPALGLSCAQGMEIDRGYLSPYFVKNQEAQTCEMESPRILITDRKVDNMNELVPLLEGLVASKEPLLIIAEDVTGEALSSLVLNKMRGVLDVCAIKSPGFGNRCAQRPHAAAP